MSKGRKSVYTDRGRSRPEEVNRLLSRRWYATLCSEVASYRRERKPPNQLRRWLFLPQQFLCFFFHIPLPHCMSAITWLIHNGFIISVASGIAAIDKPTDTISLGTDCEGCKEELTDGCMVKLFCPNGPYTVFEPQK